MTQTVLEQDREFGLVLIVAGGMLQLVDDASSRVLLETEHVEIAVAFMHKESTKRRARLVQISREAERVRLEVA